MERDKEMTNEEMNAILNKVKGDWSHQKDRMQDPNTKELQKQASK